MNEIRVLSRAPHVPEVRVKKGLSELIAVWRGRFAPVSLASFRSVPLNSED